ncbi:MAG: hypothetical protein PVI91_12470 [Gammaproteobacteria bacterium]
MPPQLPDMQVDALMVRQVIAGIRAQWFGGAQKPLGLSVLEGKVAVLRDHATVPPRRALLYQP